MKELKIGGFLNKRYRIDTLIGQGGFDNVFRAFDTILNRPVAVKIRRHSGELKTGKLFLQEAQITAGINHPPIVTILDFSYEEETGQPFIVMELLQGVSLNDLLLGFGRLPPIRAISIGLQICSALHAVHSKGILHLNLKPVNIIIQQLPDFPDYTKVIDFSIYCSILSSDAEVYSAGTPTHMPPEQFTNARGCDERSDIYSFGVVLYQMAKAGKLPFPIPPPRDDSPMSFWREMHRLHREAPIPTLDSPLHPIIQRCLEKEPGRRYQTFQELRGELEALLKHETGETIKLPKGSATYPSTLCDNAK